MIVGIPKETSENERRVALIPPSIPTITKVGIQVLVESGAGVKAGFMDDEYEKKGAKIAKTHEEIFSLSDIILQVRGLGANPEGYSNDLKLMQKGQVVIGFFEPLYAPEIIAQAAKRGIVAFSMELIPRITRAQNMDALSSMATISGYKAVLLAAVNLPKMFPMLMTAAGTLLPARVFIIGAGVAGLQAIATSKRLGAVVQAYDVRPTVKDQVQSLGAKFVELRLESQEAEDKDGYAKAMGEEFYQKQRALMASVLKESDIVITTASVPGKKAPVLLTASMVKEMPRGSVIVDLAAEKGGNCELTKPSKSSEKYGISIIGPVNLPSSTPYHASQMYAKNITNFALLLIKDSKLQINLDDEIINQTLLTKDGNVVNNRVLEALKS